jgi:hypothetical protein
MSFGYKYKLYAENIELLFKDYISNQLKEITIKGKDRSYINYRLKTKTLPVFNQYHNLFYEEQMKKWGIIKKVKIVPANIENLLDPIVLAYLIQSDGSFSDNRVRIYTNSFTKAEVELLAKAINTKFSIFTGVTHDRNNQWILTIGSRQLNLLRGIVSPYFVPSMLYRIGL